MIEKQKFERIKMCYTKFHEWHEKVQVLQTSQYKCASELIKTYPVLEYWADSGSDKKKKKMPDWKHNLPDKIEYS